MTTLVLSAHLDDAVLSCGGRLGPGSTVVTLFAGVPTPGSLGEWDARTGAEDSSERIVARHEEDRRALALVGAEGIRLPLLCNQYRGAAPDRSAAVRLLAPLVASVDTLWLPAAVGAHPDHVFTRDVGLELAEHVSVPVQLYADLPYAFLDGWPDAVRRAAPAVPAEATSAWPPEAALVGEVAARARRLLSLTRRVFRLDTAALTRKRSAIAAYASQLPVLDGQCGGRLRRGEDLATEVAWELGTVRG